ncbi:uncharacterized protein PG998_001670 [Apiospora kogelbergensis]|uniref:uncharacterized protein n=1 Tax=Apiospora kogelbergensis TaxID=1337665 RepID=UPI00312EC57A
MQAESSLSPPKEAIVLLRLRQVAGHNIGPNRRCRGWHGGDDRRYISVDVAADAGVEISCESEAEGLTCATEEEAAVEGVAEEKAALEEPAAVEEAAALVEEITLLALEDDFDNALEPMAVEEPTTVPLPLPVADVMKLTKLAEEAAEVAGTDELAAIEEPDFVDDEAVCTRDPDADPDVDPEAAAGEALEEAMLSVFETFELALLDWDWDAAVSDASFATLEWKSVVMILDVMMEDVMEGVSKTVFDTEPVIEALLVNKTDVELAAVEAGMEDWVDIGPEDEDGDTIITATEDEED